MERHQTPRKRKRKRRRERERRGGLARFESSLKGGLHLSLSRTEVDGRKIDPLRVILLSFPLGFTKEERNRFRVRKAPPPPVLMPPPPSPWNLFYIYFMIIAFSKDSMASRSSMPRARARVIVSKLLRHSTPCLVFVIETLVVLFESARSRHISRRKQGNIGELFYFEEFVSSFRNVICDKKISYCIINEISNPKHVQICIIRNSLVSYLL